MSVGRSLAWMGSSQLLALVLQFVAQVVLIRFLTPHEAGIFAVGFAVIGVLSLIQTLGLQALVVREPLLTPELSRTAFTVNAIISLLLAGGTVAVAFGGAAFLGDAGVRRVLLVLAVTPLINLFSFLPGAILEREARFREIALAGAAGSLAGAGATIVLAVSGFSYMSAAYAQWATSGVTTVLLLVLGREHASLKMGITAWRRVAEFGVQMLAVSGISNLGMRLSDIALGRVLGLAALGLYSRASGLNGLIWANVHLLIGRVMLVDFAELCRRGESLRHRYIRTVDVVTVLLWPIFAGFAVIARPFILIVYGEKWVPAATPLVFLALASIVQVAITMTWELFAATGELRAQTRIEFTRALFSLSVFVGACFVSLAAAAAARTADAVFALFLYRPHLNRMTDTRFADFVPIYLRNAMLTVAAILPAALAMAATGWSAETSPAILAAAILAGVVLWGGGLVALRHPVIEETRRWIGARRAARA